MAQSKWKPSSPEWKFHALSVWGCCLCACPWCREKGWVFCLDSREGLLLLHYLRLCPTAAQILCLREEEIFCICRSFFGDISLFCFETLSYNASSHALRPSRVVLAHSCPRYSDPISYSWVGFYSFYVRASPSPVSFPWVMLSVVTLETMDECCPLPK